MYEHVSQARSGHRMRSWVNQSVVLRLEQAAYDRALEKMQRTPLQLALEVLRRPLAAVLGLTYPMTY